MKLNDLGQMAYRETWALQEEIHARVLAGEEEALLIVEHPPVITLGRRSDSIRNLLATVQELGHRKIDLVHSDRGGDITFHGPGQIVAYPIVRLSDHGLSVSGYVHRLEAIVIAALAEMGILGKTDPQAIGVWTEDSGKLAKICAIGVRIRRGVTLHGLALNVTNDLSGFANIIPCGLADRAVTSVAKLLGTNVPTFERVKRILVSHILGAFEED